jgi:hypothetical protein
MSKEKTTGFYFKMSPEEWTQVERRMEQSGIRNKSAYIRKMCIDGHVIILDSVLLKEIGKLLRITSNNVNQIARKVNNGGSAYRSDVENVNNHLIEIRINFGDLLSLLTDITDAKPGKRFIAPPTINTIKNLPDHFNNENINNSSEHLLSEKDKEHVI